MANNYLKQFHIFKSMDNDVGNPSGYLKVEINGDMAKLQLSLNNLLQMQGILYQLYGIKKEDNKLVYTVICDIPNINGRTDIKVSTNANQVGSSCLSIENINIYAIAIQLPSKPSALKFPLVAYTKEEIIWRNEFETVQNLHIGESIDSIENVSIKKDTEHTSADSIADEKQKLINQSIDTINEIGLSQDKNIDNEPIDNKTGELYNLKDADINLSISERNCITDSNITVNNVTEGNIDVEKEEHRAQIGEANTIKEATEIKKIEEMEKVKEAEQTQNIRKTEDIKNIENYITDDNISSEKDMTDNDSNIKVTDFRNSELLNDMKLNFTGKFESVITSIYNADSAKNSREKECEFISNDNDILGSVEENFNVISSIEMDKDKIKTRLSLPDLKDELNKSFESYNPFKMKSKNFDWWKINSPGYLNNILFRNNIKTYLLFNPKVMLAHYKYRYIIFGMRKERHSGKEYFICGVPGVYSIDENPFGSMGSWVQTEGYKPKYGAFGYWIIMIEPKTGKLIKAK